MTFESFEIKGCEHSFSLFLEVVSNIIVHIWLHEINHFKIIQECKLRNLNKREMIWYLKRRESLISNVLFKKNNLSILLILQTHIFTRHIGIKLLLSFGASSWTIWGPDVCWYAHFWILLLQQVHSWFRFKKKKIQKRASNQMFGYSCLTEL